MPVTIRLPVILTSPVIKPPTFAFSELLARINAAFAMAKAELVCLSKSNEPFAPKI